MRMEVECKLLFSAFNILYMKIKYLPDIAFKMYDDVHIKKKALKKLNRNWTRSLQ